MKQLSIIHVNRALGLHKLYPNLILTYSINQPLYWNGYWEPQETMSPNPEENTPKSTKGSEDCIIMILIPRIINALFYINEYLYFKWQVHRNSRLGNYFLYLSVLIKKYTALYTTPMNLVIFFLGSVWTFFLLVYQRYQAKKLTYLYQSGLIRRHWAFLSWVTWDKFIQGT